ncbi:MAG: hypothetical protein QXW74_04750, partial [Archaeoglobaceae archaeon]
IALSAPKPFAIPMRSKNAPIIQFLLDCKFQTFPALSQQSKIGRVFLDQYWDFENSREVITEDAVNEEEKKFL